MPTMTLIARAKPLPAAHLAGVVLLIGLVISCIAIELLGLASVIPLLIRGSLATALFATAPGFLLFSYLSLFQQHGFSGLTLFLLSASLSFSCNFLINLIVFAFNLNLAEAYGLYLVLIMAATAALLLILWCSDSEFLTRTRAALLERRSAMTKVALGCVALLVAMRYKEYPGLLIEELFALRKVAELPGIAWTNISITANSPTSYIFVPFQLLLGFVSQFCRTDIIGAVFESFPYLTLVAFFLILKLLLLISNDRRAIVVMSVVFAILLVTLPIQTSNYYTLVIPTADRHGFAAGILVPLAIFHFALHVRDARTNIALLVGLVYLIVEISFVHARETLHFLGFGAIYVVVLVALGSWPAARRGAVIIVLVVFILWIYRATTLALNPELNKHVADMTSTMRNVFAGSDPRSILGVLFGYQPSPDAHPYLHAAVGVKQRPPLFPVILWFITPLYAWIANNAFRLSLCGTIVATGLLISLPGVKLLLGTLVGSWHVLDFESFLMLLLFLVFADFFLRMSEIWSKFGIGHGRIVVGLAAILLPLAALILLTNIGLLHSILGSDFWQSKIRPFLWSQLSEEGAERLRDSIWSALNLLYDLRHHVQNLLDNLRVQAVGSVDQLMFLLAFAILCLRIVSLRQRSIPQPSFTNYGTQIPVSGPVRYGSWIAIFLLANGSAHYVPRWALKSATESPLAWETASWCSGRNPLTVYDCLNDFALLHVLTKDHDGQARVPRELLQFIRTEIPSGKNFIGTDTIPVLIVAPQYALTIGYKRFLLTHSFIVNDIFVETYIQKASYWPEENPERPRFRVGDFFSTPANHPLLEAMMSEHNVDYLLAGPEDTEAVLLGLGQYRHLRDMFRTIYHRDGYLILRVQPRAEKP